MQVKRKLLAAYHWAKKKAEMAEDNLRPAGNGACDLPVDNLESRVGIGRAEGVNCHILNS
jgi:hypothetical protein